MEKINTSVQVQDQTVTCYSYQDINSSCSTASYLPSHPSENGIISNQKPHTDLTSDQPNISNSAQISLNTAQAKIHQNSVRNDSTSVHSFPDHSTQDLDRLLSDKGREEIKAQVSNDNMVSNWELFKEKFQQFRIPHQAASINNVNNNLVMKSKVQYPTPGEKFRRHSDSTAEMVFSNSINYSHRNQRWNETDHTTSFPPTFNEFISNFDSFKRRTQRATSDPENGDLEEEEEDGDEEEDEELSDQHSQQPSCSQMLNNNNNNMISVNENKNFPHNSHYQYSYSNSIHSHSVPNTPTNLNPLLSPAAPPHPISNHTHFNQSLPCTPTQPNSFTFSPHQIQQYHQQQQSVTSTSNESQLQFAYTPSQDSVQYSSPSYNINAQPTAAYPYPSHSPSYAVV